MKEIDMTATSRSNADMGETIRTPTNGHPYYCKTCGLAWSEYMACEEPDCELESAETANERTSQMKKISFEEWLSQLKAICKAYDVEDYVEQTGEQCWHEMYDDGFSPEDAWGEEVHAAQTMG